FGGVKQIMRTMEKQRIQQAFIETMNVDELMNCARCGVCLPSCPKYIETGHNEVHSPPGRIALMKVLVEGVIKPSEEVKQSIYLCLGCRACEPVCPSSVPFGRLLEQARDAFHQNHEKSFVEKVARNVVFKNIFPHQNRMVNGTSLLHFYQPSGRQQIAWSMGMMNILPGQVRAMEKALPIAPKRTEMTRRPRHLFPKIKRKGKVACFSGCLTDTRFKPTNDATLKLLQYAGCEIVIPEAQNCCGALRGHSGERDESRKMAKRNIEAFETVEADDIITNAGGCGAFLVDVTQLFTDDPSWAERARALSEKMIDIKRLLFVFDFHKLVLCLYNQEISKNVINITHILLQLDFHKFDLRLNNQIITYQYSCHLKNGQHTWIEPRKLLQAIDVIEYVEMNDSDRCCGSAGIYNIIQSDM